MSTTPIGHLRHRLTLEAATRVDDGAGGATLTWLPVLDAWAVITPRSGRQFLASDALEARVTHVIRVRRRPGIEPGMRWRQGSSLFPILAILEVENRWLDCLV